MNKEWLWWLGEFGLAAVVAVVAGFVTKDVPISILYGLFVGTVFFVLRQHSRVTSRFDRQVNEWEDKAMNFPVALSHREDIDPYLMKFARSTRDEAVRLAKEAANGELILKAGTLFNLAADFIKVARPGDKVVGIDYGHFWDTPQGEMYRQTNFDLADKGVDITRVFVESTSATPEEKKHLREEMDRQKEHLKVRWIKESRLPPDVKVDGVIIYDRYTGYVNFVKLRGISRGRITEVDELRICARRDELEKAKEMAETAIRLSEEYK